MYRRAKSGCASSRISTATGVGIRATWSNGGSPNGVQTELSAEMYVNADGESTFATKENWEVELDIDMNELFAPITMESLIEQLEQQEMQRLSKYLDEQQQKAQPRKNRKEDQQGQSSSGMGFGGAMGGLGSMGGSGGMGGALGGFGNSF